MRGPLADDPLEDDNATSWVHQYNEELARPSVNALECASRPPLLVPIYEVRTSVLVGTAYSGSLYISRMADVDEFFVWQLI